MKLPKTPRGDEHLPTNSGTPVVTVDTIVAEIERRTRELAAQSRPGISSCRRDELRTLGNWIRRQGRVAS